jgi:hypothetical protein
LMPSYALTGRSGALGEVYLARHLAIGSAVVLGEPGGGLVALGFVD